MPDDSDKDFFDLDGGAREAEEIPTSSQELLQELLRERERQQTQSRSASSAPNDQPEALPGEDALEAGGFPSFPTSALPSWPTQPPRATRGFSSAAGELPTTPLLNPGQPVDDDLRSPVPPPLAAPSSRFAQPKPAPPIPPRTSVRGGSPARGAFPAWSSFRKRSPWLVPLIFVLFFFALVLLVRPTLAVPLLFIFAAIGVLEVAFLLYVPSDAFWVVGVVACFVLMMAVAFFAFFSPLFAIALSVLLLALGIVAIRERYYPVEDGMVAVMGIFKKYNRTLQSGFNLRVPGEKVLGIVSTHRERDQARIPSITLSTGEHITLDVAMSYQVIPGQEYLAVRNTKNWKEPLQQLLVEVTQDVVSALSADDFSRQPGSYPAHGGAGGSLADSLDDEQAPSPLARINDRLTQEMRDQAADRGVVIHAVKVRLESPLVSGKGAASGKAPAPVPPGPAASPMDIRPFVGQAMEIPADRLRPAGGPATRPLPYLAGAESGVARPSAEMFPKVVFPGQSLPMPLSPGTPIAPPPRGGVPPVPAEPPSAAILSPQALAETYDAVLRRRITDIATIRRIVMQFETVANDPVLSEQVPFDAAAGAQNLLNHLYQLELQRAAQASSAIEDAPPPPSAPQISSETEEI